MTKQQQKKKKKTIYHARNVIDGNVSEKPRPFRRFAHPWRDESVYFGHGADYFLFIEVISKVQCCFRTMTTDVYIHTRLEMVRLLMNEIISTELCRTKKKKNDDSISPLETELMFYIITCTFGITMRNICFNFSIY